MKKIVKNCLISFLLVGLFAVVFCATYLGINFLKFQSLPLNAEALSTPALSIAVFDSENKPTKEDNEFNGDFCSLESLHSYTPQAFISIEDKKFFEHKGLNYKRMVGAMISNLKSHSLKEGASTISQQLIKNTHLSGEKTFERKLKEMALTKKLERTFSKEEILESYLNIIFFGNNCYGLESASQYYFNKSAKDLTLAESCTLAGLIKSPSKYSPIHNPQNSIARRNLVLSEMEKDGHICAEQKIYAQNQPLTLNIQNKRVGSRLNTYSQCAIDEAAKILKLSPKQIAIGGFHIHTYQNSDKQTALCSAFDGVQIADSIDTAGIVIDSKNYAVTAYVGNSNFKLMDCRRQPASCLKPLLVYAPALNEGVVSPDTQILDEKITIGDYSPANVNKKYAGYMSVTDAVKNSVNIPAIKVLSYIGIDTGKQYAEKLGLEFDPQDDSYALALGGMTYGVNLKQLASAYTVFSNGGEFAEPKFVQFITDKNNKLVYVHHPNPQMVLRQDSAYLMTSILQETAKTGTARKLADIQNTEVAAKTGTVGKKNASGNTDAYNISFTPEEVTGIWFGNLSNQPQKIAGGNQPTEVAKAYIKSQTYQQTTFDVPSSVAEAKIDTLELEENHRLVLANPYAPERFTKTALFSRFNMPNEVSKNFAEIPEINAQSRVDGNQIVLSLSAQRHLVYEIYKNNILTQTISNKSGDVTIRLAFPEKECSVKIVASYGQNGIKSGLFDTKSFTKTKEFSLQKSTTTQQQPQKEWFI